MLADAIVRVLFWVLTSLERRLYGIFGDSAQAQRCRNICILLCHPFARPEECSEGVETDKEISFGHCLEVKVERRFSRWKEVMRKGAVALKSWQPRSLRRRSYFDPFASSPSHTSLENSIAIFKDHTECVDLFRMQRVCGRA
jgi:hypothetical protein